MGLSEEQLQLQIVDQLIDLNKAMQTLIKQNNAVLELLGEIKGEVNDVYFRIPDAAS